MSLALLRAWLRALRLPKWVRSFLRAAWPYLAIIAFGYAVLLWYGWRIRVAEQRGRASIAARADTVLLTQKDTVRVYTARTDTVIRRVVQQTARVDSVAQRIPDSVLVRFPVVDTVVIEVKSLAVAVDSLGTVLTAERQQRDTLTAVLSRSIAARDDAIRSLSKRPTRRRLWLQTAAVGAVTFLVTKHAHE